MNKASEILKKYTNFSSYCKFNICNGIVNMNTGTIKKVNYYLK